MAGLAVYTTDYDPQRVYTTAGAPADRALVEQVVRYSDAPLELVVDCGADGGRVVWSFRGKRGPATDRTTSFVADFTAGPDEDLFAALSAALQTLHEAWHIPPQGDLRGDLGFSLWRLAPGTPGLDAAARAELWSQLDADSDTTFARPAVVGMRTLRSALQAVRACQAAATEARVAVATAGDPTTLSGIDLVLVPGDDADFVPQSPGAETLLGAISADVEAGAPLGTDGGATSPGARPRDLADTGWGPTVLAIAVVVVSLAGVVVLSRGGAAPRFLGVGAGCGLIATGVVLGADRLAARRPWLTIACLGALVLGAGGAGGWALLHALNILRSGTIATVVAGAYLGFLMSFGLYATRTAIVAGADAVVPGIRSLGQSSDR